MRRYRHKLILLLSCSLTPVLAQEIAIPDPALETVIRDTLQKLSGPLTVEDMLSLTNLDASSKAVIGLEGLGAASNLV